MTERAWAIKFGVANTFYCVGKLVNIEFTNSKDMFLFSFQTFYTSKKMYKIGNKTKWERNANNFFLNCYFIF
jgi:hypothetical protein